MPFLVGLKAGKVELDEILPEMVSKELAMAPVFSTQKIQDTPLVGVMHLAVQLAGS